MTQSHATACRTALIFGLGESTCALPTSHVREVTALPVLDLPPGMPPVIEGFFSRAGVVVPVLRSEALFGVQPFARTLYTPLILVGDDEDLFALVVKGVENVVDLDPSALTRDSGDEQALNGCVDGQVFLNGRMVHVLSPGRLMAAQERQRLAELTALAGARAELWEAPTP